MIEAYKQMRHLRGTVESCVSTVENKIIKNKRMADGQTDKSNDKMI